jgi:hypothetical protein
MSIRQQPHSTPDIIPRTEFVYNFKGDPRNVYVDENDFGVSHVGFPDKYTSAVQNPWFCYDEALQRIRQEAAGRNHLDLDKIKLFTGNRHMQNSQDKFSKHQGRTWDGHSFLGSNKRNHMELTDTRPNLSVENRDNIKKFEPISGEKTEFIKPIRGEKKGFKDKQDIIQEIDYFRYKFQHAKILPGHYSNKYTPHSQENLKTEAHGRFMGELKLGIHSDLFSNTPVSDDQDWEYRTDLQRKDSNNHHRPQFFNL